MSMGKHFFLENITKWAHIPWTIFAIDFHPLVGFWKWKVSTNIYSLNSPNTHTRNLKYNCMLCTVRLVESRFCTKVYEVPSVNLINIDKMKTMDSENNAWMKLQKML